MPIQLQVSTRSNYQDIVEENYQAHFVDACVDLHCRSFFEQLGKRWTCNRWPLIHLVGRGSWRRSSTPRPICAGTIKFSTEVSATCHWE